MSDPLEEFARAEAELQEAGNGIRQLKCEMKAASGDDDGDAAAAELSLRIQERVEALNKLKERYCEVILAEIKRLESCSTEQTSTKESNEEAIARLEQLLPSAAAKERKSERRRKTKQQKSKNEKQFNEREGTEGIKCQRKIHSLMHHEGEGDTFRYFPRLNDTILFDEGDVVYLTEKMDGTTMQATKDGVYKRFDRKSARKSKKWHSLSDEERYNIERVDLSNRSNQYIARAIQDYLPLFTQIPEGVCIYFEAIDPSIGARFDNSAELSDTIFVFDSARDGEFLSFGDTVELCKTLGLPCVAYSMTELSLSNVIETLSQQEPPLFYSAVPGALLEGFVVRSTKTSAAAKIRVDDIPKISCKQKDDKNQ